MKIERMVKLGVLMCLGMQSCQSDGDNSPEAERDASQSSETIKYPTEELSWEEVVKKYSEELCGFREVESNGSNRKLEVVFRNDMKKYMGVRYSIEQDAEGDVVKCQSMGEISTTGAFFCHAFYNGTEGVSFEDLYTR